MDAVIGDHDAVAYRHTAAVVAGKKESMAAGSGDVQVAVEHDHHGFVGSCEVEDVVATDWSADIRGPQAFQVWQFVDECSPAASPEGHDIRHLDTAGQPANQGR